LGRGSGRSVPSQGGSGVGTAEATLAPADAVVLSTTSVADAEVAVVTAADPEAELSSALTSLGAADVPLLMGGTAVASV